MLELSFREDVSLTPLPENGALRLEGWQFAWTAKKLPPGMKAALQMLVGNYVAEEGLLEQVSQLDGPTGAFYLYQYLSRLSRIICYRLTWQNQPLATLTPFVPLSDYRFQDKLVDKEQAYVLSRFAYIRKNEAEELTAESPLGHARVILHDARAGTMLSALARPQQPLDLVSAVANLPEDIALAFTNLLLNARIICALETDGTVQEETHPVLGQWDFPDLLLHKYSRMGWKELPYGGTYRFRGKFEPLPVVKSDLPEETIDLYKPDLDELAQTDKSFTAVLEQRQSIRRYRTKALTVEQLGEFLYRSARVKRTIDTGPDDMDISFRPYPGGGALYELEIYPVVGTCKGLDPGLYYYHPLNHQLHKISEKNQLVENLLTFAWMAAAQKSQPQVLLAIAARFQRVQWKYESIAYAVMLKNVGVLLQTMYLVATAMELAPCALGGGNSELFAHAAGLDYYAETTVGEFLLGSRETIA